jgi:phosphoenolpyruvate carboxykinase (GTP)
VLPGGCGKTNLAMLIPTIPGWTLRCVGDDIAWLHIGEDGKLYAINPEAGFFDIPTGRSLAHDRSIMATVDSNTIFTNVGVTADGDVWWDGKDKAIPSDLTDWTGQKWTPDCGRPLAHSNARYLTAQSKCPVLDPEAKNPNGVPISAFIFGSRRKDVYPLVHEAFSWEHGVLMAAASSTDHTPEGIKYDPLAMRSYCGYDIAEYLNTWASFRSKLGYNTPKIFGVNWFREKSGQLLWPGLEENSRVLKWICQRLEGNGQVKKTPIGFVPSTNGLDVAGLGISKESLEALHEVNPKEWLEELDRIQKFYSDLNLSLPPLLQDQVKALKESLATA